MSHNNGLKKQIISSFETRDEFMNLLKVNPGLVIVKLGATWCGPCKAIAHIVEAFFATSPPNVICADIDVDESIDFVQQRIIIIFCYQIIFLYNLSYRIFI